MRSQVLIEAAELQAERARWFVLDTSVLLPGQTGDLAALFTQSRIQGARFLPIEAVSDAQSDLPHMLGSVAQVSRVLGALGVSIGDKVVCYDRTGVVGACRAWWMLRLMGMEHVRVLNGGLGAWIAAKGAVEQGDAPPAEPCVFEARAHYARLAGVGDVQAALQQGIVLDARSPARFAGTAPEPRSGVRSGHMPGARNLPSGKLLAADECFLDDASLAALFAGAGVASGKSVVTTCGSGLTASVLSVGLAVAGLQPGALYDGSWAEWGRDAGLPVATGEG